MRVFIAILLAVVFANSAIAQQGQPADQSPPPSATVPSESQQAPATARQPSARRIACTDKAKAQGLRGQQRKDSMQLCLEEARLSCTKQAIEKKIPAEQRRDFIRNCAG